MNDEIIDRIFSANSSGDRLFRPYNRAKLQASNSLAKSGSANALNNESKAGESRDMSANNTDTFEEEDENEGKDKVTFLTYFMQPSRIVFGSMEGCVTFYNMAKRETTSFALGNEQRSGMSRILQVLELPPKVADVRKHIYYILSSG